MIEIEQLTKVYGEQRAVDSISFKVERGQIVGFLGPNGAGKSTTMKIVTCYMPPTSGKVTVGGRSVTEDSMEVRKMIGYLPELNPLYVDMNVVDFLRYVAALRNVPKESRNERIRKMIDMCGLGEVLHKNIGELSKGYKQRVGLAQAMIHDPEILILDEPTIGLDPNQVVDIRHLIKKLGREKTVVLSTHILSEVQATCDRAVIINRGRIVADSTITELQRNLEGKQVIALELRGNPDGIESRLTSLPGVEEVRRIYQNDSADASYRITSAEDIRPLVSKTAAESGWTLIGLSREVRSLEDVFHKLTMEN